MLNDSDVDTLSLLEEIGDIRVPSKDQRQHEGRRWVFSFDFGGERGPNQTAKIQIVKRLRRFWRRGKVVIADALWWFEVIEKSYLGADVGLLLRPDPMWKRFCKVTQLFHGENESKFLRERVFVANYWATLKVIEKWERCEYACVCGRISR